MVPFKVEIGRLFVYIIGIGGGCSNQLGEHGLQLVVFLLPVRAIVWMNCRIDIHIVGIGISIGLFVCLGHN